MSLVDSLRKNIRLPLDNSAPLASPEELFWLLDATSKRHKLIMGILGLFVIISGTTFMGLASSLFATTVPSTGGSIREGIIGTPRFVNPLLASTDADHDLSALVYSGLLRHVDKEHFIPDLASSYEVSEDGLMYTFHLKPDAHFQDGTAVTADDVIFTIRAAQNPAWKSPLRSNWEGVNVEAPDTNTVRFTLKQPYAPFLENSTLGILPSHIWRGVKAEESNLAQANQDAIGSGPYAIDSWQRDKNGVPSSVTLSANPNFALGKPFISRITLNFFSKEGDALSALARGEIDSLSGISAEAATALTAKGRGMIALPLPRVFGVFYNINQSGVLADASVRKALSLPIDRGALVGLALSGFGTPTLSPLGETDESKQGQNKENQIIVATNLLETARWKMGPDNIRTKSSKNKKDPSKRLVFTLSTDDSPELSRVAAYLAEAWKPLGVSVDTKIYETADLNANIIRPRKFDALLFGEVVGRFPDPYAFWHSSQRTDPGLNISQYTSPVADKILVSARTVASADKRMTLYREFETLMAQDNPALFLYAPEYIYIPAKGIQNMDIGSIAFPADRFGEVYRWYIKTDRVWEIFN